MLELNKIYCGDCLNVMKDIDGDSIDCIVTDPPYQLSSPNTKKVTKGFMGKSWDICPSIEIWRECLRVLKPGAFAFVMCIPRQDCLARMICRLEDAEFNVSFSSVLHTFASGFPKAQNLSKKIDQRAGVERELIGKSKYAKKGRVAKESSIYLGESESCYISLPATPQAKALDGAYSGFQPKPAVEIVIVVMKSLEEKTYIDQALKNGHGCTWLDDCRIPFDKETEPRKRWLEPSANKDFIRHNRTQVLPGLNGYTLFSENTQKGRFPANVLCEDDVLDDGRIIPSTERPNLIDKTYSTRQPINFYGEETKRFGYPDKGSFSRYFSLDAWFAERNKQLPKEAQKTFPWLIVPKASKSEKNRGLEELEYKEGVDIMASAKWQKERGRNPDKYKGNKNNHPTCKPIKLMSWVITLASREGDIVLDPFCGSGTTLAAAKMLGRQYIGIEREEEYCEIARKRIAAIPSRLDSYDVH